MRSTAWIYGVTTTSGSTLASNDLLAKEEFPDATTGDASTSASDDVAYDYDNLGEDIDSTDQNGTTHAYGMDLLGRPTSDSVTVLGSGVDGSVRLHTTNYNEQGDVYQMTAYADTGGMTLVNQVQDEYNGLGQLTGQYQANSGAVDTSTTPETQYAYSDPTSGSLMTSMTYPNGRVLDYGYTDNALDTAIGRVDFLADAGGSASGHLVDYLYMGLNTMVQQADANGVELTYLQQSGDSSAITSGPQYAGDEVTGLDRFGQVIDQNWVNTSTPTPTTTDRFQYDYDQDGDVLYSNNLVNPSGSELYHSNTTMSGDDNTAYDPLARLTDFERGTLRASDNNSGVLDTVSDPSETQSFALDAVGNQTAVDTNGTTVDNTANAENELTANGSSGLTFDNDGNTLVDQSGNTFTYDPWNHIATVKNSSDTTIATYESDALGRRVSEDEGGTTTNLLYNGQQIIELRQGSTVTDQYVYNIDYVNDVLLRDDNSTSGSLGKTSSGLGQRLFQQHDTNYNNTALVNTSGVVVQRQIYSPYGTTTVLSPSWASATDAYSFNPGFQGMWQDLATGLYYTPNRDYSAALERWTEADPAGYMAGPNRFRAVDDDPIGEVDPEGLAPAPDWTVGDAALSPASENLNAVTERDRARELADEAYNRSAYHWDEAQKANDAIVALEESKRDCNTGAEIDKLKKVLATNAAANQYWWRVFKAWQGRQNNLPIAPLPAPAPITLTASLFEVSGYTQVGAGGTVTFQPLILSIDFSDFSFTYSQGFSLNAGVGPGLGVGIGLGGSLAVGPAPSQTLGAESESDGVGAQINAPVGSIGVSGTSGGFGISGSVGPTFGGGAMVGYAGGMTRTKAIKVPIFQCIGDMFAPMNPGQLQQMQSDGAQNQLDHNMEINGVSPGDSAGIRQAENPVDDSDPGSY